MRDFSDGSVLAATLPVVLIREARLEDEAALLPIHLATWTAKVSPGPAPDPTAPFFDPGTAACDVLVAEDSGGILGYVRLHQPGPMPSHEHVLVVNGLAVDPVRQPAGVGRALMHAALQRARARGACKVTLRVLAPNAPARRLYEACGFAVEGVLRQEFRLNDGYVDDVLMACELT